MEIKETMLLNFVIKAVIIGFVVTGATELAKRSTLLSAILVSLPITSVVAMFWLYNETKDAEQVGSLSTGIFWMVLPSLFFFLIFPVLLRNGFRFYSAMIISCISMALLYWGYSAVLKKIGIVI